MLRLPMHLVAFQPMTFLGRRNLLPHAWAQSFGNARALRVYKAGNVIETQAMSLFYSKSNLLRPYCAQLRNRFQERCKKEARRSRRRIGPYYCRRPRPILTNRGKRFPRLVRRIGHPFTPFCDFAVTFLPRRRISCKVFLPICLKKIR